MDKLGVNLEITQKFYIISPAEKKDTRVLIDKNRE
jgi:hypothetical protein